MIDLYKAIEAATTETAMSATPEPLSPFLARTTGPESPVKVSKDLEKADD